TSAVFAVGLLLGVLVFSASPSGEPSDGCSAIANKGPPVRRSAALGATSSCVVAAELVVSCAAVALAMATLDAAAALACMADPALFATIESIESSSCCNTCVPLPLATLSVLAPMSMIHHRPR